jgi:hypothetical protein
LQFAIACFNSEKVKKIEPQMFTDKRGCKKKR